MYLLPSAKCRAHRKLASKAPWHVGPTWIRLWYQKQIREPDKLSLSKFHSLSLFPVPYFRIFVWRGWDRYVRSGPASNSVKAGVAQSLWRWFHRDVSFRSLGILVSTATHKPYVLRFSTNFSKILKFSFGLKNEKAILFPRFSFVWYYHDGIILYLSHYVQAELRLMLFWIICLATDHVPDVCLIQARTKHWTSKRIHQAEPLHVSDFHRPWQFITFSVQNTCLKFSWFNDKAESFRKCSGCINWQCSE